eukprot:TRINITY_DN6687_c0_g1_i2.p1 TRINITY_DN6687_c0_g1~~TRINITY_DN6687_c0_g1_i2.p1  ORF type:complete len:535 (+),score=138.04 TRINITY_DN6687_c0_g1_i2:117-1721(+)
MSALARAAIGKQMQQPPATNTLRPAGFNAAPAPIPTSRAMSAVVVPTEFARKPSIAMRRNMSVSLAAGTPILGHVIIFLKGLMHMIAIEGDEDESWSEQSIMGSSGELVGKLLCRVSIQTDVDFDTEEILLEGNAEQVMEVWKTWRDERKHVEITIQLKGVTDTSDSVARNGMFCRFQFNNEMCKTALGFGSDVKFDFTKKFDLVVTDQVIDHLQNESLFIDVIPSPSTDSDKPEDLDRKKSVEFSEPDADQVRAQALAFHAAMTGGLYEIPDDWSQPAPAESKPVATQPSAPPATATPPPQRKSLEGDKTAPTQRKSLEGDKAPAAQPQQAPVQRKPSLGRTNSITANTIQRQQSRGTNAATRRGSQPGSPQTEKTAAADKIPDPKPVEKPVEKPVVKPVEDSVEKLVLAPIDRPRMSIVIDKPQEDMEVQSFSPVVPSPSMPKQQSTAATAVKSGPGGGGGDNMSLDTLQHQVEQLRRRVKELEQTNELLQSTNKTVTERAELLQSHNTQLDATNKLLKSQGGQKSSSCVLL